MISASHSKQFEEVLLSRGLLQCLGHFRDRALSSAGSLCTPVQLPVLRLADGVVTVLLLSR